MSANSRDDIAIKLNSLAAAVGYHKKINGETLDATLRFRPRSDAITHLDGGLLLGNGDDRLARGDGLVTAKSYSEQGA